MDIVVKRFLFGKNFTMSRVYINGDVFCYGLEPYDAGIENTLDVESIKQLKNKYGKIAIPLGSYKLTYEWSNRYKKLMPRVNNVPGFEGILWHIGNTEKDSRGCLLIGTYASVGVISNSSVTFNKFISLWKDEKFNNLFVSYQYETEKQILY